MEQAVDWPEIVTAEKRISESRKGRVNRQRLFNFAVFNPINRQNHAVWRRVFFQVQLSRDDNGADRIVRLSTFFQADQGVVVDGGSGAETTFLVVANENEFLNV